ncbi:MAG: DUF2200 family protein [Candidatus Cryptobacteroides sp.]|nr:DUF2200 family protein [Candidatus Cryptobacteroides sp.]
MEHRQGESERVFAKVFPCLIAKAGRKGRTKDVKGKICGVRVETIENPMMRDLRILDKLVDELAKR